MSNTKVSKSLRMNAEHVKALEKIAAEENRSFNYVVNEIIAKHINTNQNK